MRGTLYCPIPAGIRSPAVAGVFYPDSPDDLDAMVGELFEAARAQAGRTAGVAPTGLLVPHAGLVYSGVTAAAAWLQLLPERAPSVVVLGTNHAAGWHRGVGVWDAGAWRIPTGEVAVDAELADAIVDLGPPFAADRAAHTREHSIEVQLPLLRAVAPAARIVPLAVSAGRGSEAFDAGRRLGELLARWPATSRDIVLVISSDMAHYPEASAGAHVTRSLLPSILALDARGLARQEGDICASGIPGLVCGMCGIEPAILGLAALRAMGATLATPLGSATSADAGGPLGRTVGYLSARFDV